ncbi:hypothetical protein GCM10009838_47340 [Catenulispora subtropica]|uniref:Uncharacterized protein n=1 Tax=Catenulispora subtropica TaxID=450798 RepID=A0ABN2S5E9_9ACTN
MCDLFRGLGFAADRIFLVNGPDAADGILEALCAAPDLGHGDRLWCYRSGDDRTDRTDRTDRADRTGRTARAVFRADCPRRVLLLDRHGVLAAALTEHLDRADLPLTAGQLAARLADVAQTRVPPTAAAMLLFPHLLDAADVHRLRSSAADAAPVQAAAIWREMALLDPQDADARLLQAHFETLARHSGPPF